MGQSFRILTISHMRRNFLPVKTNSHLFKTAFL